MQLIYYIETIIVMHLVQYISNEIYSIRLSNMDVSLIRNALTAVGCVFVLQFFFGTMAGVEAQSNINRFHLSSTDPVEAISAQSHGICLGRVKDEIIHHHKGMIVGSVLSIRNNDGRVPRLVF